MTTQKTATPLDLPAPLVNEEIAAFYSTDAGFKIADIASGYGIRIDHANCALIQQLGLSDTEVNRCIGEAAYKYDVNAALHNILLVTKVTEADTGITPRGISESFRRMDSQPHPVREKIITVEGLQAITAVVRFIHYADNVKGVIDFDTVGYPRISDSQLENLLRTRPEMTDRIIEHITERGYDSAAPEESLKALTDYLDSKTEAALGNGWL